VGHCLYLQALNYGLQCLNYGLYVVCELWLVSHDGLVTFVALNYGLYVVCLILLIKVSF
jgi:hypothetical protein